MKKIFLGLTLSFISMSAAAEQLWYGVASVVHVVNHPMILEDYDHSRSERGGAYNLAVGYEFNKNLAAELEWQKRTMKNHELHYSDNKTIARNNAMIVNAIYKYPATNQIQAYAKAGIGLSRNSLASSSTGNQGTSGYNYPEHTQSKFAYGIGAGMQLDLSKHIDLGLELRRMNLGKAKTEKAVENNAYYETGSVATEITVNIYFRF
ncbi:MAG: porin family protein [Thiolinea sp.]